MSMDIYAVFIEPFMNLRITNVELEGGQRQVLLRIEGVAISPKSIKKEQNQSTMPNKKHDSY